MTIANVIPLIWQIFEPLKWYALFIALVGIIGTGGMLTERAAEWANANPNRPLAKFAMTYFNVRNAMAKTAKRIAIVGAALLAIYIGATWRPSDQSGICHTEIDNRGSHSICE